MTNDHHYSKGALSSHDYDAMDIDAYYADIDHLMPQNGVIIDIGGAAGRDALRAQRITKELPYIINTDPDPARYEDAKRLYGGKIEQAENFAQLRAITQQRNIPHIICGIDNLDAFNKVAKGVEGDFVLCNAVMMFIPLEKHQDSLHNLFNITATAGHCVIRYRTENLTDDMVTIDHDVFDAQCRAAGFEVTRTKPLADPAGRDHVWHQLILKKPYPTLR